MNIKAITDQDYIFVCPCRDPEKRAAFWAKVQSQVEKGRTVTVCEFVPSEFRTNTYSRKPGADKEGSE